MASIGANPKLEALRVLVGEWRTTGSHPYLEGITLHGRATFEWIEGGAFLHMYMEIDEPRIPAGIAIFGTDDAHEAGTMLYFDERGVSRQYEWTLTGNVWKYWRMAPGFSQLFTGTIVDDGRTIISKGELSRDGVNWEPDLELTYTRVS